MTLEDLLAGASMWAQSRCIEKSYPAYKGWSFAGAFCMKQYTASVVLLVIGWGLFIGLLGREDAVFFKHTVAGVAPWVVVIYMVASSGLSAYRRNQDIRGHLGYVALFVWMLGCVAVNRLNHDEVIGLRFAGLTFFVFAIADVSLGFLVPVRWIGGEKSGR